MEQGNRKAPTQKKGAVVPFSKSPITRYSVTQDNSLIEASYKMTLTEKRLLLLGISKIDPMQMPKENKPLQFEITADEWGAIFKGENAYREMKKASDLLITRQVIINGRDGHERKMNWVDSCDYHPRTGKVVIKFGYTCSLYLAGMVDKFTEYALLSVSKLSGIHAIRIWELCMQFRSTGYRKIGVSRLREILQLEDEYATFSDFRKWVVEAACKEITKKSEYNLSYNVVKQGRVASHIEFFMEPKPQMELPLGSEAKG